jgi:MAF protein
MSRKKRIILASTSPYRASLLRNAGIRFEVIKPEVDESLPRPMPPERAVVAIARKKLAGAAARVRAGIIIASDQAMEFRGGMVGKPGSEAAAVDLLMKLSGREHRLLTSLVVKDHPRGRTMAHLDVHVIRLRRFSRAEARRYVRLDRPLDCAGAIKIESRGIMLIERARGEDYTAIIGLPMMALGRMLSKMGLDLFQDQALSLDDGFGPEPDMFGPRPWTLDPKRCALLVMDMQRYFTGGGDGLAAPVIPNINLLSAAARSCGMPVIFTQHGHEDPDRDGGMLGRWWGDLIESGTPDHALDPSLLVGPDDTILPKKRYSAFAGTDLEGILRKSGVDQLIITGTMTNLCCETTARDAFVRDFEVFFAADACATLSETMQRATLLNLSYGFSHVTGTRDLLEALG